MEARGSRMKIGKLSENAWDGFSEIKVQEPSRNLAEREVVKRGPEETAKVPKTFRREPGGDIRRARAPGLEANYGHANEGKLTFGLGL